MPLFSVDTHHDAGGFDVLAFGLAAELVYTNVLECLDLAGVPVRAEDRRPEHPLVVAGGHCAFNPEPMADFVDAFVIGDGEEAVGEITEVGRRVEALRPHRPRGRAARARHDPGRLRARRCTRSTTTARSSPRSARGSPTCPSGVDKRTVADLAEWPYPKQQLVPLIEVVHDRLNVEVFRGCTRGCRFCQAGMITRPVRERPDDQVRTMVQDGLRRTGYDEVALTSLSTRRLLRDRRARRRPRQRAGGLRQRRALAAVAAGRRVHRRASPARSRRCAAPASRSRPRAARGGSAR